MMKTVRLLIVEDEIIIAESLASMLKELGYLVSGIVTNLAEALQAIQEKDFDLVLVDINLEHGDEGFVIAEKLKAMNKAFIYVTSYSDLETVKRARQSMPEAYIVKPFNKSDLLTNIEIVSERLLVRQKEDRSNVKFMISDGTKKIALQSGDVLWVRAEGIYLEIKTIGKKYLCRIALKDLMLDLSGSNIHRVHRSWAVNLEHAKEIHPNKLIIEDLEIPISRSYRQAVKDVLTTMNSG